MWQNTLYCTGTVEIVYNKFNIWSPVTFLNMKRNYDNVRMEIKILLTTNTWIMVY